MRCSEDNTHSSINSSATYRVPGKSTESKPSVHSSSSVLSYRSREQQHLAVLFLEAASSKSHTRMVAGIYISCRLSNPLSPLMRRCGVHLVRALPHHAQALSVISPGKANPTKSTSIRERRRQQIEPRACAMIASGIAGTDDMLRGRPVWPAEKRK